MENFLNSRTRYKGGHGILPWFAGYLIRGAMKSSLRTSGMM
jgi:hypothetical protein